jgi:DUF971 family protein
MCGADRMRITWNDGQLREYAVRQLRENCPCATCREKRSAAPPSPLELPVISRAEAQPLTIAKMEPTGRYAYAIHFSDGHDTGIFTLESLRELGEAIGEND